MKAETQIDETRIAKITKLKSGGHDSFKQGRCSYALVRRDAALAICGNLLAEGYIRHRPLGSQLGFQIEPKGREYLGGQS